MYNDDNLMSYFLLNKQFVNYNSDIIIIVIIIIIIIIIIKTTIPTKMTMIIMIRFSKFYWILFLAVERGLPCSRTVKPR